MSFIVEKQGHNPAPAGGNLARVVSVLNIGLQPSDYNVNGERQFMLGYELVSEPIDAGKNFIISDRYNAKLGPKSKLGVAIATLTGASPINFDVSDLLGRSCSVTVIHKPRADGAISARVGGVSPVPKGTRVPEAKSELLLYDVDVPDGATYEKLPEWIRGVISEAKVEAGIRTSLTKEKVPF